MVTDTKYYDVEQSEESQRHSKKETETEKTTTFTWDDMTLQHGNHGGWVY